ncbi:hypothetical protein EVAR_21975_1 [Eumeta japonica]|uniref:Uncharacterized protein n=1 Tax=Eumeta variegata TaxID=151549 RepID=A0A4C1VVX6_EUMVA|nr:hypothetical protein EVAR_21975_1 [Eumeta japonica]
MPRAVNAAEWDQRWYLFVKRVLLRPWDVNAFTEERGGFTSQRSWQQPSEKQLYGRSERCDWESTSRLVIPDPLDLNNEQLYQDQRSTQRCKIETPRGYMSLPQNSLPRSPPP